MLFEDFLNIGAGPGLSLNQHQAFTSTVANLLSIEPPGNKLKGNYNPLTVLSEKI